MSIKENSLTTVTEADIGPSDFVRVLDGDTSRKITTTDFADVLNPLLIALGFTTTAAGSLGDDFLKVTTVVTNYGILAADSVILGDTAAGELTVALPTSASSWTAATAVSQTFVIKRITGDVNKIIISAPGIETIDGNTTYELVGPNLTSIKVVTDGTNWHVIA